MLPQLVESIERLATFGLRTDVGLGFYGKRTETEEGGGLNREMYARKIGKSKRQ